MRRVKKYVALMLAATLAASTVNTIPVSADEVVNEVKAVATGETGEFVEVIPTPTTLIGGAGGTAVTQSAAGHFQDDVKGAHSYYWQFTLDEPGLVTIESLAKVFEYNFNGDSTLYIGTDLGCSSKIDTGFVDGSKLICQNALEAGTYYIRQDITKESTSEGCVVVDPTVSLSVAVQSVRRTGDKSGASKANAIPVANGGTSVGLITGQTSNGVLPQNSIGIQYFQIQTDGPATLDCTAAFTRHTNLEHYNSKSMTITNALGAEIGKNASGYGSSSLTSTVKLPAAGIYYIEVKSERFQMIQLSASWKTTGTNPGTNPGGNTGVNSIKPPVSDVDTEDDKDIILKVNKIKKNAKKVKGTAVPYANIKVKVGGKTYVGSANSKGKFTIKVKKLKKGKKVKVTASKSGYITTTKTVKVK